jgi:hypothetical protein
MGPRQPASASMSMSKADRQIALRVAKDGELRRGPQAKDHELSRNRTHELVQPAEPLDSFRSRMQDQMICVAE